jgi:hypothetical protein
VDLAKLSSCNKGFKYLLTCIDVLSRYAWVVPLKDKMGKTLKDAFQVEFTTPPSRIKRIVNKTFGILSLPGKFYWNSP